MPRRPQHIPHTGLADQRCRYGCGATVTIFTDDATGILVQLDATPPSVTTNLTDPDYRDRLWEFRGQHLGWVTAFQGQRTWRPCLIEHDCAHTPATHKPRRSQPIPPLPSPSRPVVHTTTTRTGAGHDRPVRRTRKPGQSQVG